uniref:Uncharacterized protein n=1 Tax=Arundo donax TaxID=35708 RepID=A0A0A8ZLA1_ARUDO
MEVRGLLQLWNERGMQANPDPCELFAESENFKGIFSEKHF